MPKFYGAIDLVKNELQNAIIQNLGGAPATPTKGQIYFNSTDNVLYWYNGTGWVAAQGGAGAVPATTVTTQAVGDAPVVGIATTYAREDHKHGREGFGNVQGEGVAFGTPAQNGSAVTVAHSDHKHGNPAHDDAAHSTIHINALAPANGSTDFNNQKIISVADPTAGKDGANKDYVDNAIAGLSWKDSVRAATTVAGTLATSFANGLAVDGVVLVTGNRILIKNQAVMSENGIYVVTAGAPTRATDFDAGSEVVGAAMYVEEGTVNNGTAWTLATDGPIVIGTTSLVFTQFGGGAVYSGGAGLVLNGSVFDVVAGDTTLTVAADSIVVNTGVIATLAIMNAALAGKASKYAGALVGTASPEVVTHNLNTRDISVTVYNGASPYTAVECDWDATTANTVTIRFNPVLGAGYRVVVMG
jgi:hypothetical protein